MSMQIDLTAGYPTAQPMNLQRQVNKESLASVVDEVSPKHFPFAALQRKTFATAFWDGFVYYYAQVSESAQLPHWMVSRLRAMLKKGEKGG